MLLIFDTRDSKEVSHLHLNAFEIGNPYKMSVHIVRTFHGAFHPDKCNKFNPKYRAEHFPYSMCHADESHTNQKEQSRQR